MTKNATPYKVHVIFGVHEKDTEYEWIGAIGAWDEFSIDENLEGYNEALEKARESADEVRVVVFTTTLEMVEALFRTEHRLPSTAREGDEDGQ